MAIPKARLPATRAPLVLSPPLDAGAAKRPQPLVPDERFALNHRAHRRVCGPGRSRNEKVVGSIPTGGSHWSSLVSSTITIVAGLG